MSCPGDFVRGKEGIKAFRPRQLYPQEVDYTGLNMLGDTARGKEKVSACPGTQPAGRRREEVSTSPAISPAGRRR